MSKTCGTCARFAHDAKRDGLGACLDLPVRICSGVFGYGEVTASGWACSGWVDRAHNGEKPEAPSDEVAHPSHYATGAVECKDAMRAVMDGAQALPFMAAYWWGCAFKYLWRWNKKNGLIDLQKCKQCIDFLIEEVSRGEKDGE